MSSSGQFETRLSLKVPMSTQNKRTSRKKNVFDMKASDTTTMTVHKISEDIETPTELFINSDLSKPRVLATANTTTANEMGI
jgi:hypothetical protein